MSNYYNQNTLIFLNENFIAANTAHTSLYSQTLHYGSGVFEGIRSYKTPQGTRIFKAKEHYERLHFSAKSMHINLPYSVAQLTEYTYELLEKNNLSDAYIRPLVYLGENMSLTPTQEVNVVIMAWEWGKYLGDKLIRVMLSHYQRPNPKSCNVEAKVVGHYINSILATTEAKNNGFDEALLCDMKGNIAEGPGANFFVEKDNKLYTAPLGNILAGITRATIIEIAASKGIEVIEKYFSPDFVLEADSAFFCGTAAEVSGIASVNDYTFPLAWEKSMGALIQKAYKALVVEG
ncbi:MAG: branched-chain amino acid transaminase [Chitinophagales bacterium]|nr:branched-chain amino acid transaminase [Bacteroidota bacterium]MCB9042779.1 branched-chain amino acid transaminase [Chitinophagales bacterium]